MPFQLCDVPASVLGAGVSLLALNLVGDTAPQAEIVTHNVLGTVIKLCTWGTKDGT